MALFVAIIGGTALVSIRRPGAAIGLMVVMFGLEQMLQAQSATFVKQGSLVQFGVAFVAVVAASKMLLKDITLMVPSGFQVWTLILYGFAFSSSLWTIAPDKFEAYFQPQWPYFALYFLLGPVLCAHPKALSDASKSALIIGVPVMIAIAFFCEWTGRGIRLSVPVNEGGRLRNYTPPLAAASCAAMIAILTLATTTKQAWRRLSGIAVMKLCTYIIVLTQSRGQLLAFCVVVLLVYPATHRSTSSRGLIQLFVILMLVLAAVYGVFLYVGESAGARWQQSSMNSAFEGRAMMASRLVNVWLNSDPVAWMIGLGASSSFKVSGFYVHNVPIEVLCEFGIFGATIFAICFWKSFQNSLLFAARIPFQWEHRCPAIGFIGAFVFLAILTLKEGTLYAVPHMFFIAIMIDRLARLNPQFDEANYRNVFLDDDDDEEDFEGIGEYEEDVDDYEYEEDGGTVGYYHA
ncbi:MAG: O-antigen ligase family protein [Planctomycetota bacterium]